MTDSSDHLELTFRSMRCFMDDGKIDAMELASIIDIAERDGHIDDEEKKVLRRVMEVIADQAVDDDLAVRLEVLAEILSG